MKQRIRLTEGDLHRIIRDCINETLDEIDMNNEPLEEGIGNWGRACIDGIANVKNYSQGNSNKKYMNWINNVEASKHHMDDLDTLNKARKNGTTNSLDALKANARYTGYQHPGSNRRLSDDIHQMAMDDYHSAGKRHADYERRKKTIEWDKKNGTNHYEQLYGKR